MYATPPPISAALAAAAVQNCPYCRSDAVQTTGKTGQTNTYWRCSACGEVWSPLRAQKPLALRPMRSW